jgi:hypothetical protein
MEPVCFIDPLAAEEASMAPPHKPSPVPSTEFISLSRVVFSNGREREVRQLIHDLAILTARQNPTGP